MTHAPGTTDTRTRSPDQPLLIAVGTMAGALALMGVVLTVVGAELVTPPTWMLLVVVAASAGSWALAVMAPLQRPAGRGVAAVQSLVMVRAAVIETPAIVGLALAFVAEPTNLTVYLVPAIFALAGLWLLARPGAVRARLARDHHAGGGRPLR